MVISSVIVFIYFQIAMIENNFFSLLFRSFSGLVTFVSGWSDWTRTGMIVWGGVRGQTLI